MSYVIRHSILSTSLFLCATIVMLFTFLLSVNVNPYGSSRSMINRTNSLPNIIIPTFLRFNQIEILDFVLHEHSNRVNQFSIYLSGRRHSWSWSDVNCLFADSNESVHGIIDRRSKEPFVLCPLPAVQQQRVLDGHSQLIMSLRIDNKQSPNVTVPIYNRNRYNVSMYTMIHSKTEVLVEWIEYHRLIGVEHFYLYDHFSTDNLDYFLRSYLQQNVVTIVRWPYKSLQGHHWNMMQSASMNHALKTFGSFNRWMGYFDVDEYFQILVNSTVPLADFLDGNFPESTYPGGVQFRNCPISCLLSQNDLVASRYRILFEKCRHITPRRDCQIRTKMFIRPRNVPIMQNIHALQYGIKFASSSKSASLAQLRHYHYGTVLTDTRNNETIDKSMDKFIDKLKTRIITYQ